jgi:hypothetical protein
VPLTLTRFVASITRPRQGFPSSLFSLQGWVLDPEWQEFIILDDELDELRGNGLAADGYPVTYIWQLTSLESPKQTGLYKGTVKAVDHNQYIKGTLECSHPG